MRIVRFTLCRSALFAVATLSPVLFASSAQPAIVDQFDIHGSHDNDSSNPALVEKVRHFVGGFQNPASLPAGYAMFPGCVSGPQSGAMGVHFVNQSLLDGTFDVSQPEAVIYEFRNGYARLVGVEYIVIADAWRAANGGANAPPPVIEGQMFQLVGSPNRYGLPEFYELHVWAFRDNPNGAFVDWNPRVTCEGQ